MNFKNLLAGVLSGVAVMLVLGAGDSPSGRYHIASSNGVFMIVDTETGKAWYSNLQRTGYQGESPGFWDVKK